MEVPVALGAEKLMHKAEATEAITSGVLFLGNSQRNMYKFIDGLADIPDRQIMKQT